MKRLILILALLAVSACNSAFDLDEETCFAYPEECEVILQGG